ncbi:unnamed protein product [Miscanthus lutarioriparius]|uniref:Uncharacterized protein n=1 Tax=Miscanthus lutarioriparius TaxID=422564 RepID=A0A811QC23_9POAL|nr:unnamed protein product [Miscanthus lutarioriparius]
MASSHDLTAMLLLLFSILSGGLGPPQVQAQQPYGTQIADCPNQHNSSGLLGYFCGAAGSSAPPSCPTFLTFTARPPRSSLASIGALLGADPASVLAHNDNEQDAGAGADAPLPAGTRVLVPTTCACTATPGGRFYQRNATYVAAAGDTLFIIANNTFQGLTSCQALEAQGLRGAPPQSLDAGQSLPVPLRCACPTAAQAAAGARFLVSYLVDVSDELAAVAARFGVDAQTVAEANQLQPPFTIFPYTTLLIPVSAQPNVSRIQTPPPAPPLPPVVVAPAPGKKSGSRVGVYIGVAVAVVAVATIASAGAFLALRARRRRARAVLAAGAVVTEKEGKAGKGNDRAATSSDFTVTGGEFSLSTTEAFSSISVTDIKSSLKVYTYAELKAATDDFSPDRRIGGSVYRAAFNGDAAAVEVVDRNVSTEVELMRKINHLNLIRLIGLCHHRGRWYLVTEYAEHGALRDRLLAAGTGAAAPLTWAQRVQVGLDVAEGLRYLHEYARPAWVHMDVSSGSVLLAGDGPRAKLRGFGAARAITGATAGEEALFTMTSRIAGTRGYIAPEYLEHGLVSPKADVYSLGVMLLELVTGRDAEELVGDGAVGDPFVALRELAEELDGGGDAVLQRLEELVDPALPAGSCPQDAVVMVVRLIERCVKQDPARRPTTGEVAQRLLKLSGVSVLSWRNSPESPRSSGSGKGLMY